MIEVRLFATFREDRFKERRMDFPEEGLCEDLLGQLDIGVDEAGILLVNGDSATPETKLHAGDVVSIFPAIGGG